MAAINGDTANATIAGSTTTKSRCHLLELPPELRNRIYDLCFTTTSAKEVDLFAADEQVPCKAVLLTCRQIYEEARLMHSRACRDFCSNSRFLVAMDREGSSGDVHGCVDGTADQDLARLERLRVTCGDVSVTWSARGSAWSLWVYDERSAAAVLSFQELWLPKAKALQWSHEAWFMLLEFGIAAISVRDVPAAELEGVKSVIGEQRLSKAALHNAVYEVLSF